VVAGVVVVAGAVDWSVVVVEVELLEFVVEVLGCALWSVELGVAVVSGFVVASGSLLSGAGVGAVLGVPGVACGLLELFCSLEVVELLVVAAVPVWLAFWSVVLDGVIVELLDGCAVPVVSLLLVVLDGCDGWVAGCADWSVVADGAVFDGLFVFCGVVLVVCAVATPSASVRTDIGNRSLFIEFKLLETRTALLPRLGRACFYLPFKDSMDVMRRLLYRFM